jgi:RNA polymerase sigma factor (sigma-70 family)
MTDGPASADASEVRSWVTRRGYYHAHAQEAPHEIALAVAEAVADKVMEEWGHDLAGFLAGGSCNRYVKQSVHWTLKNVVRSQKRLQAREDQFARERQSSRPGWAHPLDKIYADELTGILDRVIARMPLGMRQVYLFSQEEGLSPAEVAEALGIAASTVRVQLVRAVSRIQPVAAQYRKDGSVPKIYQTPAPGPKHETGGHQ